MINLITRRLANQSSLFVLNNNGKNKLKQLFLIQSNNICHKDDLDPEHVALRLPPFPYKEKRLTFFHRFWKLEGFLPTVGKFTENTKVVVVEGNIGAGKEELGKKLAEDLGMKFFPDINPEMDYLDERDGFDYRSFNKHLPEDVWYPDFKSVLETKNPFQAGQWEMFVLRLRTYNYLCALTHLLNTGDGVVLERCAWTGTAFARTLRDLNYVSQDFLDHYWQIRSAAFQGMYRPHVIIYLDVPVDECLENARKKNTHGCGHLLDEQYLETVEKNLKNHYLPIIEEHAEVFTYKLNKPVTEQTAAELSELIVDELSQSDMDLNLMRVTSKEEKFEDWRDFDSDERWSKLRFDITKDKDEVLRYFEFYPYYVDELWPAYSLIFAKSFLVEKELSKRDKKFLAQASIREKIFGRKLSYDEKDSFGWLIKNDYYPDHIQAVE